VILNRNLILLIVGVLLASAACSGGATPAASATPVVPTSVPPTATLQPTATPAPTNTPKPTHTPEPVAASGDACPVGAWELSDLGTYMSSILPATAGAKFSLTGQDGYVHYVFGADGSVAFEAQDFVVRFTIAVSGVSFDMEVGIDGAGSATYAADAGSMTFSNSSGGELTFYTTLAGTQVFSGTSDELASLFGISADAASATFSYQCEGDTLTYTPPIENAQPVVLTRVGP